MSKIEPAVDAIVHGISEFLGPPTSATQYVVFWSLEGFEVAVQRDTGPHIWLSAGWRPSGQPFAGLTVAHYPAGKSRISNLAAHTPTLGPNHDARRISFVSDKVGAAVRCVRACALAAGAITEEPTAQ